MFGSQSTNLSQQTGDLKSPTELSTDAASNSNFNNNTNNPSVIEILESGTQHSHRPLSTAHLNENDPLPPPPPPSLPTAPHLNTTTLSHTSMATASHRTRTHSESRLTTPSSFNSASSSSQQTTPMSLLCPPTTSQSFSQNLSVQHRREHSHSFTGGLDRIVEQLPPPVEPVLRLNKSKSTEMLKETGKGTKKKRKWKGKLWKGSSTKKNQRSMETLERGREENKPPMAAARRRHTLMLEPRGPLYGDDDTGLGGNDMELCRYLASSQPHLPLEGGASVDQCGTGPSPGQFPEHRVSIQPSSSPKSDNEDEGEHSFLQFSQNSLRSADETIWQEFGQI